MWLQMIFRHIFLLLAGPLDELPIDKRPGSNKTESVSALDKITGDALRLQVILAFLTCPKNGHHQPTETPRGRAAESRTILEVAKEAFTRSGANASLDDIAKQAGVGPGTLYRHFPTREELLQTVYRSELEKLAAAEAEVRSNHDAGRSAASLASVVRGCHRRKSSSSRLPSTHCSAIPRRFSKLPTRRCTRSDSRPGEARDRERRHTQRPRPTDLLRALSRRRQRGHQP
jgi:AcrR family transcriptional regulator